MAKRTIKWRRFSELSTKGLSKLCNLEKEVAEAFVIPPILLGNADHRLMATEVKARLQHYGDIVEIPDAVFPCHGMCEPHRVRHVDSRVIEPKQLSSG